MAVNVTLTEACTGSHVRVTVNHNGKVREFLAVRSEFIEPFTEEEIELTVMSIIKLIAKQQGITTWNQAKTYFNNRQIIA